ncbi:unnamed protein product [Orchesella dallaii]|uniref:Uncharacterized protein n=1 Tax=Orchesella dallaii TaxID=48710 RepID=A0ABP1QBH0_9HEXA
MAYYNVLLYSGIFVLIHNKFSYALGVPDGNNHKDPHAEVESRLPSLEVEIFVLILVVRYIQNYKKNYFAVGRLLTSKWGLRIHNATLSICQITSSDRVFDYLMQTPVILVVLLSEIPCKYAMRFEKAVDFSEDNNMHVWCSAGWVDLAQTKQFGVDDFGMGDRERNNDDVHNAQGEDDALNENEEPAGSPASPAHNENEEPGSPASPAHNENEEPGSPASPVHNENEQPGSPAGPAHNNDGNGNLDDGADAAPTPTVPPKLRRSGRLKNKNSSTPLKS